MFSLFLIGIGILVCSVDSKTTILNGVDNLKELNQQTPENRVKRQDGFGLTIGSWPPDNGNNVNNNPFLNNNVRVPQAPNNNFLDNPNNNGGFFQFNNQNPAQQSQPSTTAVPVPGMGTTRSPCEDRCQATTQFDPVCADNNVTYTNINWFRCAQRCGLRIRIQRRGACSRF